MEGASFRNCAQSPTHKFCGRNQTHDRGCVGATQNILSVIFSQMANTKIVFDEFFLYQYFQR